jgi:hypothetical protein
MFDLQVTQLLADGGKIDAGYAWNAQAHRATFFRVGRIGFTVYSESCDVKHVGLNEF